MDSLQRLIFLFFFLLLSSLAVADEYPAQPFYKWSVTGHDCSTYDLSTLPGCIVNARNAIEPDFIWSWDTWVSTVPPPYHHTTTQPRTFRLFLDNGSAVNTSNDNVYVDFICRYGGQEVTSTSNPKYGMCINVDPCPEGHTRNEYGACVPEPEPEPEPEQCEDGRELDSGYYTSANNPIACIQGCRALRVSTGSPVLNCDLSQGVGVCDYIYPARYVDTGVECSPSTEPPKETPKPDCPYCRCMESGGSWGSLNGVDTCVPLGTPGSNPVIKPSGPPTVTTTTPAPTPENPDPEPVTEVTPAPVITVTPPPAGAPAGTPPTVTETTTDPATGGTITTERDKKTYCQENPAAQICRDDDKSIFSGSCESFRCEGDAIQCAIALKQHQTVCDMQKGDAMSDLGQQLTQGQGGVENPLENPEQVSLDALDTSSFMPKGGLQDMSFSIVGQSFTLPLSNLNAGLEFAGYIVLAFAFIAAARIVFM